MNRQAAGVRGVFAVDAQPGFGHGPLAYAGTMMGRRAYLFLLTVVAVVCRGGVPRPRRRPRLDVVRDQYAHRGRAGVYAGRGRPAGAPTFRSKGSDGKFHIAYDLGLTNAASIPATIESIDVVDAGQPRPRPRLPLEQGTGRSRVHVRRLQPPAPPAVVTDGLDGYRAAGDARSARRDCADSPDDAPKAVLHRLRLRGAANPGSAAPTLMTYLPAR